MSLGFGEESQADWTEAIRLVRTEGTPASRSKYTPIRKQDTSS